MKYYFTKGAQRLLDTFFPSLEFKNMGFFYIHQVCKNFFLIKRLLQLIKKVRNYIY